MLPLGLRSPAPQPAQIIPESRFPATRRNRGVFAVIAASVAAVLTYVEPLRGGAIPDFGQVWFGAVALLHGGNPYKLIGDGMVYHLDFPFFYPITSSIVVLPLGLLPEMFATAVFMWISVALFAYALTHDGWYRLPLFLSSAFVFAARRGQWSPLLSAAYFMPGLAWVLPAKPNIGLAILASLKSEKMVKVAVIGGLVLGAIGFVLVPSWPADWVAAISEARHTAAPVTHPGGFLVLLALFRWRRPEARMLVTLACIPHSMYWYDLLPLMLIPSTFREALVFALLTTTGLIFEGMLDDSSVIAMYRDFNTIIIAVGYLPATIMILRRANVGRIPFVDRTTVPRTD